MNSWKRVEPTNIHKVGHRIVVTKHFRLPNGTVEDYQTFHAEGMVCTGVIAITPDGKIVTAHQFRPGPERMMYDIPGGFVEKGEKPLETAKRELQEETGYIADDWSVLGATHKEAYNNGTWHYFLALNARPSKQRLNGDHNEFIEPVLLDITPFIEYTRNGKVSDPDGVFVAYDKLKELEGKDNG